MSYINGLNAFPQCFSSLLAAQRTQHLSHSPIHTLSVRGSVTCSRTLAPAAGNFPITGQHALPPETQLPVMYQLLNWRNETASNHFNPKMMMIGKTHFWQVKFTWMCPQVKTFWSAALKNWRVFCHMICWADVTGWTTLKRFADGKIDICKRNFMAWNRGDGSHILTWCNTKALKLEERLPNSGSLGHLCGTMIAA